MFLIGICIVDACLAYKLAMRTEETRAEIYPALAEEIRDNTYDQPNSARNQNSSYGILNQSLFHNSTGMARSGINAHLTPTKKNGRDSFVCYSRFNTILP